MTDLCLTCAYEGSLNCCPMNCPGPTTGCGAYRPKNQCDGCRRGLPLRDGIHYDGDRPYMGCTKDKCQPPVPNALRGLKLSLYPIRREH
jgi:hypothetical protein